MGRTNERNGREIQGKGGKKAIDKLTKGIKEERNRRNVNLQKIVFSR